MGIKLSPEATFALLLNDLKIPYEREYCFNKPHSDHRFDFAVAALKLAFEVDGGAWVKGRHNTAIGSMGDDVKDILAWGLGWRVIHIPSAWLYHTRRKKAQKYLIPYEDLKELIKIGYENEKLIAQDEPAERSPTRAIRGEIKKGSTI